MLQHNVVRDILVARVYPLGDSHCISEAIQLFLKSTKADQALAGICAGPDQSCTDVKEPLCDKFLERVILPFMPRSVQFDRDIDRLGDVRLSLSSLEAEINVQL